MDRPRVIEKLTDFEFKIGDEAYKIVRELGRGGNGVAFLCHNSKNQKAVAKVYLPPDKRDLDEKALERFENEVALTERLKHPNIVPSLGSGAVTMGTYPPEKKLGALRLIKSPIRPRQIQAILAAMNGSEAYDAVLDLRKRGLLLVDWSETDLQALVAIDEERAWPEVEVLLAGRDDFRMQNLLPHLSLSKRLILLKGWIERGAEYSWHFSSQMRFLIEIDATKDTKVADYHGKFDDREKLLTQIRTHLKRLTA